MWRMGFVLTSVMIALAGCGNSVEMVSAGSDGVTLRHLAGYEGSATNEANNQCNVYGKKARLRSSHDDSGRRFAIYDCVPM